MKKTIRLEIDYDDTYETEFEVKKKFEIRLKKLGKFENPVYTPKKFQLFKYFKLKGVNNVKNRD